MRALRRHLVRHNVRALGLAVTSMVAATVLWAVLVFTAYWFSLLTATVHRGMDLARFTEVDDARDLVDRPRFVVVCALGAVGLTGLAMLGRSLGWSDSLRERRFPWLWALGELVLLAPTLTLSVWGNLRALIWLRHPELRLAWRILQATGRHEARGEPLAWTRIGVEVGERTTGRGLSRALFALQLAELVQLRSDPDRGWSLSLAGDEARALCKLPAV